MDEYIRVVVENVGLKGEATPAVEGRSPGEVGLAEVAVIEGIVAWLDERVWVVVFELVEEWEAGAAPLEIVRRCERGRLKF